MLNAKNAKRKFHMMQNKIKITGKKFVKIAVIIYKKILFCLVIIVENMYLSLELIIFKKNYVILALILNKNLKEKYRIVITVKKDWLETIGGPFKKSLGYVLIALVIF